MNAYRTPPPRETSSPLTYDYAQALEKKRPGIARESFRVIAFLVFTVGLYPFVALFGDVGVLIGLAAFAFIAVPLAIRGAWPGSAGEIEAYEEQLLAKTRKRSRRKRR